MCKIAQDPDTMRYSKNCIVTSTVCYNVEDAVFRAAGRTAETDVVTAVGDAVTMAMRNAIWMKPFTGHPGLQDFLRSCGAAHEV
jgi:hypothetical protein